MDKNTVKILFLMILISFLLACNIYVTTIHILDYSHQRDLGNQRWNQVENKILEIEGKVNGAN